VASPVASSFPPSIHAVTSSRSWGWLGVVWVWVVGVPTQVQDEEKGDLLGGGGGVLLLCRMMARRRAFGFG
jgi:hypothetical protein